MNTRIIETDEDGETKIITLRLPEHFILRDIPVEAIKIYIIT